MVRNCHWITHHDGWGLAGGPNHSVASNIEWMDEQPNKGYNGCGAVSSRVDDNPTEHNFSQDKIQPIIQTNEGIPASLPANPSAPPIPEGSDDGPIHYPAIDSSPVGMPCSSPASVDGDSNDGKGGSSSCTICWEAPIEDACIPCGHMAGWLHAMFE